MNNLKHDPVDRVSNYNDAAGNPRRDSDTGRSCLSGARRTIRWMASIFEYVPHPHLERRKAAACRDRTAALITIADTVVSRYQGAKDRRGLLDYDDLIDKANAHRADVRAWLAELADEPCLRGSSIPAHLIPELTRPTTPPRIGTNHYTDGATLIRDVSVVQPGAARRDQRKRPARNRHLGFCCPVRCARAERESPPPTTPDQPAQSPNRAATGAHPQPPLS